MAVAVDLAADLHRLATDGLGGEGAGFEHGLGVFDHDARRQQRLGQAKARYSEIETNGQGAARLYTPFMKALQDQVTYLGHDLNASAVASLKPEADKLNVQAKELYSAIDKTTAAATSNISQLSAN